MAYAVCDAITPNVDEESHSLDAPAKFAGGGKNKMNMWRHEYMHGKPGRKYGIWNSSKKEFQFGIKEDSPMLAEARLVYKIGDDAKKWRFEARILPKEEEKC